MELNILCPDQTPEQVRESIEERPDASLEWRDDDWRVSYGFGPEASLDVMFLAELNASPNWEAYLGDRQALVRRNVERGPERAELLDQLSQQAFALTLVADPIITDADDPRLGAVLEFAGTYGALVSTPNGLYDAQLSPLLSEGPLEIPFLPDQDG